MQGLEQGRVVITLPLKPFQFLPVGLCQPVKGLFVIPQVFVLLSQCMTDVKPRVGILANPGP